MTPEDYIALYEHPDTRQSIKMSIYQKRFTVRQIVDAISLLETAVTGPRYWEVVDWLRANAQGQWAQLYTSFSTTCFELEEDAVLFRLMWS